MFAAEGTTAMSLALASPPDATPDATPTIARIRVADIEVNRDTHPRVELDAIALDDFADEYRSGRSLGAVVVFRRSIADRQPYYLADGFFRVLAARRAGLAEIDAEIREGGSFDALCQATAANAEHKGNRLTAADKRKAIRLFLASPKSKNWTNRRIAATSHASPTLVGIVRRRDQGDEGPDDGTGGDQGRGPSTW